MVNIFNLRSIPNPIQWRERTNSAKIKQNKQKTEKQNTRVALHIIKFSSKLWCWDSLCLILHLLTHTHALCGFAMLVHNSQAMWRPPGKCYMVGLCTTQLSHENETFKPEITCEEGEAGKKGVSYQNVENTPHIEVIMIPQKSECNLDGLVAGRWQSTCVRGEKTRHVGSISRRHWQPKGRCPHKYWQVERNVQKVFLFHTHLYRWNISSRIQLIENSRIFSS